ncbi:hypothetical protein [Micromonospora inyonensis]|uniref:hypothetical protein n=1 Tax=Micromonospora inyonensis TaxID=47866 RepID=UPI00114CF7F0|nr:hypothetical protein [Micromonospora inyonensis]
MLFSVRKLPAGPIAKLLGVSRTTLYKALPDLTPPQPANRPTPQLPTPPTTDQRPDAHLHTPASRILR